MSIKEIIRKFKSTPAPKEGSAEPERVIHVSHENIAFDIECANKTVQKRARTFASKEPETINWLKREISPTAVFWDIGANIGLYSLYASSLAPECEVFSFEPESQNYANLCKNIWMNSPNKIKPYLLGVCGPNLSGNIADLYLSNMSTGSAVHNLGAKSPWYDGSVKFMQPCYCATIDALVSNHKLPPPSVLKIDVDGIELDILEGGRSCLERHVRTMLVEIDSDSQDDVRQMTVLLEGCGFSLVESSGRTKQVNAKTPRNFIWKKQ